VRFKVTILGVGGVGHVCASEIAKSEYLTDLVLADISTEAAEKCAQKLRNKTAASIEVCRVDASDKGSVAAILEDVDVLLYAGIPEFNFTVMQACLDTRTHYIDMASASPDSLLKQLDWSSRFKQAGILGIMGLGCDPGFSNIAAKYAADQLDTVKSITILDGDNSDVDYEGFCAYFSPQTAIQECLAKPNYWTVEKGMQYYSSPFANKDEFEFPDPIGWLDCYVVEHEEAATLGKSIGKGCEYVEFRYALHPDFVNTLQVLSYLGLDRKEPIRVDNADVIPLNVVVTTMPKPAELAGKIHGYSCVGANVKGTKGDKNVELFVYTIANHDEIYQKSGFQATVWQTGVPPVVAIDMIAEGILKGTGCIPPEMIDPAPFLKRLKARGMDWYVMEKTSPMLKIIASS